MYRITTFLGVALSALVAPAMFGATLFTPCPVPVTGSVDGGSESVAAIYLTDTGGTAALNYSNATKGCNVLITYTGATVATTNPNGAGYWDSGLDDNLVGIVNNSGHAINSINLTSATVDIFGFDSDGICDLSTGGLGFAQTTNIAPATGACSGTLDASGYGPAGVSFSGINAGKTSGTVNFAGGIANGATAWFALEGPVALDLTITPEPGTITLVGVGCLALGLLRRRMAK